MIRLLVRLYPGAWRRRYGDEFAAVLGERPLGPFDVADVLLGALDAHLHRRGLWTEAGPRRGSAMTLRIGGLAAIVFGLLWGAGIAWASFGQEDDDAIPMSMTIIADVALIVAVVGLSAFQARRHWRLVWAAVLIPAVAGVITVVGTIGMQTVGDAPFVAGMSPWNVWVLGVLGILGGSILFAAATWTTRALTQRAAGLVGFGAAACSVSAFVSPWLTLAALIAFSAGWIWLGVDALRRDRPAIAPAI